MLTNKYFSTYKLILKYSPNGTEVYLKKITPVIGCRRTICRHTGRLAMFNSDKIMYKRNI